MWFATENGLNRYDGKWIRPFFKNDAYLNINFNFINSCKLIGGKLWVTGLNNTNIYELPSLKKIDSISYTETCQIQPFSTDTLLVGFNSVFRYTTSKGFTKLNLPKYKNKNRIYYRWYELNDRQYLGYYRNIIHIINKHTFEVEDEIIINGASHVQDIATGKDGRIWFGTWNNGLHELDLRNKKSVKINLGVGNENVTMVKSWQYRQSNFIIASVNGKNGLIIMDEKTNLFKTLDEISSTPLEKPLAVSDFFEDKSGNIWLATNHGVKLFSNQNVFKINTIKTPNDNFITKAQFSDIKYVNGEYWASKRYFEGVFILNTNFVVKKHLKSFSNLINAKNKCLDADAHDFIPYGNYVYLGTNCGLMKLNTQDYSYQPIPLAENELFIRKIATLTKDIWLIKGRDFIYKFSPKNDKFLKKYTITDNNDNPLLIPFLFKSQYNDQVYAITENDIYKYNSDTDTFKKVNSNKLSSIRMVSAIDDSYNRLWLSTYTGLVCFDMNKNIITNTFENETDMSFVLSSCMDKNENVWFNCQRGYWCYVPEKKQMIKFDYQLGLPDNRETARIQNNYNGQKILAGAEDAIIEFDPDAILYYKSNFKPIVSEIYSNSKSHQISVNENQKIFFDQSQRNISIHFSVPDYAMFNNYEYFYKLNNVNDSWIKAENGRINFDQLQAGTYELSLKGKLLLNGLDTPVQHLNFEIEPFYYETWWFKCLLLLSAIGLFFFYYQYRVKRIRQQDKLKSDFERKVILLELQNLRSQMNPHFIFNSLNSINGFIIDNETHLASDYLTKFSRLVRLILENSKNETVSLNKELETLKLYLMMEGLRFENKFKSNINIESHLDSNQIKIPPMIVQPYVENAIWHGLLHKRGGYVNISFSKKSTNDLEILEVEIEDNGIGRQKATDLKTMSGNQDKSYGMEITQQRIKNLNRNNKVKIQDIYENGLPAGTKVIIEIVLNKSIHENHYH